MRYLNFKFILPDGSTVEHDDITVTECWKLIPELFKTHYNLDVKCSRHHIYNLAERPYKASQLFRQKMVITMVPKPGQRSEPATHQ